MPPSTVPATGTSNEWTLVMEDSASGGTVVGEYTLTFDDSRTGGGRLLSVATVTGGAYNAATGLATVTVAGGPIEFDLGAVGGTTGLSQLSDSFTPLSVSSGISCLSFAVGFCPSVEKSRACEGP